MEQRLDGLLDASRPGARSTMRVDAVIAKTLENVPEGATHWMMDNYARTRRLPSRIGLSASRFHMHFTPTSASWLNQVERWFAT